MIEFAVGPGGNRVARGARGRRGGEPRGDVIRNVAAERLRFVPIRQMAAHAVGGTQRVVVIDVAGCAGRGIRRLVRSQQRKTGDAVIEGDIGPARRIVTIGAIRSRKGRARRRVWRIICFLPGGQMATRIAALHIHREVVVAVDMAGQAGHVRMPIGQRESAMVEFRSQPTVERMAGFAGRRELCRHVIRIGGFLEVA